MAKAYLTVDDSPSTRMDDLTDFFSENGIPALFFCRGDRLEENPIAAVRAIQQGFLIGNHSFSHKRASEVSAEEFIAEIEKTQLMIDKLYQMAGVEKSGQYFRFPHLDRGCGSQVINFDEMDLKDRNIVKAIFTEGLNVISNKKSTAEQIEKKEQIQEYLKDAGYTVPFEEANLPWYKNSEEIQAAADCLFTFSSADWMLTQRHLGKWRYQSYDDLSQKIFSDQWLLKDDSVSIILIHDQAEIIDVVVKLVSYLKRCKMEFLEMA